VGVADKQPPFFCVEWRHAVLRAGAGTAAAARKSGIAVSKLARRRVRKAWRAAEVAGIIPLRQLINDDSALRATNHY